VVFRWLLGTELLSKGRGLELLGGGGGGATEEEIDFDSFLDELESCELFLS
jgi:hypothetical protein